MGVAIGDYDRSGTMDIFKTNFAGRHLDAVLEQRPGVLRRPHVRGRHRRQHALAGLGHRVRRLRQRRLAGPLPRQRPRLSRGGAAPDGGGLRAAQGRLRQSRQRPVRGRDGAARASRHHRAGGARGGLRRRRRRRRRGRRGQQRQRAARPVPHRDRARPPLAARQARGHDVEPQRDRRRASAARPGGVTQWQEVRGGGSYISQNDLRAHFGLGRGGEGRSALGALAQWPRGGVARRGRGSGPDAPRRQRRARRRDDGAAAAARRRWPCSPCRRPSRPGAGARLPSPVASPSPAAAAAPAPGSPRPSPSRSGGGRIWPRRASAIDAGRPAAALEVAARRARRGSAGARPHRRRPVPRERSPWARSAS